MKAYRLFEVAEDGALLTLFHRTEQGSRRVPIGEWLEAKARWVSDGSGNRRYRAGFHIFAPECDAETFVQRHFRRPRTLAIVEVEVKDLRPKPTNPNRVLLARHMRVPAVRAKDNIIRIGEK
jgi:hypothetical protein